MTTYLKFWLFNLKNCKQWEISVFQIQVSVFYENYYNKAWLDAMSSNLAIFHFQKKFQ